MKYLVIALLILFTSIPAMAGEMEVEKAMIHLMAHGMKSHKIKPHPNHPMMKDHEARKELAHAISEAAHAHDIPEMLMVAIAYREGSFSNDKIGGIGERSSFQMLRYVAKRAQQIDPKCDLKTYHGAARCSAAWLAHWSSPGRCKNLEGAIMMYATGKGCTPTRPKHKWIIRDRLGIAKKLERMFREVPSE
jgi:hypothetical protein